MRVEGSLTYKLEEGKCANVLDNDKISVVRYTSQSLLNFVLLLQFFL